MLVLMRACVVCCVCKTVHVWFAVCACVVSCVRMYWSAYVLGLYSACFFFSFMFMLMYLFLMLSCVVVCASMLWGVSLPVYAVIAALERE